MPGVGSAGFWFAEDATLGEVSVSRAFCYVSAYAPDVLGPCFRPPCLALVTWLVCQDWTASITRGVEFPLIKAWEAYDFWIILAILYSVMFGTALREHKF